MQAISKFVVGKGSFRLEYNTIDADGLRDYIILHSQYNLVREGMQSRENYFVPPNQSLNDIPRDIENLYFGGFENEENITALDFSSFGFTQLRAIRIGGNCFRNVREFILEGLEQLETIKIGDKCFVISNEEREDGICRITNCPKLRQIEIGFVGFIDFKKFELSIVNSLQTIEFDQGCFTYADQFVLKGR